MTLAPSPPKPFMLRSLIVGRSIVAISFLLAPRLGMRLLQIPGDGTPAPAIARMFAARNALLAVGLSRLDSVKAPRAFLWANAAIDAVDALAFIDARLHREFNPTGTALSVGIATSATVAGVISALQTPRDQAR